MGQINNFSESDKVKIVNFDIETHKKLERNVNVCGDIFGGQIKNTIEFIDFYYKAIKLFIIKNLFIGKDQNIYSYVAFAHPEIINLIKCKTYRDFKQYLMQINYFKKKNLYK